MIKCKEVSQLVSRSLEKKLSFRERFALKFHLLMCKYCARFSQQLSKINVAISSMTKSIEDDTSIKLPSKTKARIVKSLESDVE
ncbi:MAG: zf-HC2 domain-containing protein [Methylophilaceae bacterium]